jgi:hypothetical protein
MQRQKYAHFMEFASGGTASPASEGFCFFADTKGNLSSDFLFFSTAAWACSSRRLCGAALDDVIPCSCALGLSSVGGATAGGDGLPNVFPSMGTSESAPTLALLGGGPNLSVIWVCVGGGSGAEEKLLIAGPALVSAWSVVNGWGDLLG